MNERGQLGAFLREVIDWPWDKFLTEEKKHTYSPLQGTIFALVREASEGKLGAIKLSIRRVDGQIETPVDVQYPRLYFRYPYAKTVEGTELPSGEEEKPVIAQPTPEEFEEMDKPKEEDLVTFGLRETLKRMAETPDRRIVPLILAKKKETEVAFMKGEGAVSQVKNIPLVKSVISAHLLSLATEQNNFEAILEVFEQIDGKLVEVIRILGDDLYLDQYDEVAPAGAIKDKNGIYVLERRDLTEAWAQRFAAAKKLNF